MCGDPGPLTSLSHHTHTQWQHANKPQMSPLASKLVLAHKLSLQPLQILSRARRELASPSKKCMWSSTSCHGAVPCCPRAPVPSTGRRHEYWTQFLNNASDAQRRCSCCDWRLGSWICTNCVLQSSLALPTGHNLRCAVTALLLQHLMQAGQCPIPSPPPTACRRPAAAPAAPA